MKLLKKIRHTFLRHGVFTNCAVVCQTVCQQVAQLLQRDHAAGWVSYGQNLDWNWETIFTDIINLSSTTVTCLASKAIEFGEKRKKGYYAV